MSLQLKSKDLGVDTIDNAGLDGIKWVSFWYDDILKLWSFE